MPTDCERTWHHLERERHLAREARGGNRMTAAITVAMAIGSLYILAHVVVAWIR